MTRIVALVLIGSSTMIALTVTVLWFRNPHLTQMQLLIRYWYLSLAAFALMATGGWLYGRCE